jgi:hypothetical protein
MIRILLEVCKVALWIASFLVGLPTAAGDGGVQRIITNGQQCEPQRIIVPNGDCEPQRIITDNGHCPQPVVNGCHAQVIQQFAVPQAYAVAAVQKQVVRQKVVKQVVEKQVVQKVQKVQQVQKVQKVRQVQKVQRVQQRQKFRGGQRIIRRG